MVTADEIPDPYKLELTTWLNGQVMQNASIDLMMFSLEELISYISTFISLEPGDVIVSGTPGGVGHGRKPPLYLKDEDVVEVDVTGIGRLRNPVVKERAEPEAAQKATELPCCELSAAPKQSWHLGRGGHNDCMLLQVVSDAGQIGDRRCGPGTPSKRRQHFSSPGARLRSGRT
jgi:hypothetical protein